MEYFKNITTDKIFVSLDGEHVISPSGKHLAIDPDLYVQVDDVDPGDLSVEQRKIIDNRVQAESRVDDEVEASKEKLRQMDAMINHMEIFGQVIDTITGHKKGGTDGR